MMSAASHLDPSSAFDRQLPRNAPHLDSLRAFDRQLPRNASRPPCTLLRATTRCNTSACTRYTYAALTPATSAPRLQNASVVRSTSSPSQVTITVGALAGLFNSLRFTNVTLQSSHAHSRPKSKRCGCDRLLRVQEPVTVYARPGVGWAHAHTPPLNTHHTHTLTHTHSHSRC